MNADREMKMNKVKKMVHREKKNMEPIAIFKPGVAVNLKSYLERLRQIDPIILHIWESVGQDSPERCAKNTLRDIPQKDPACHIGQLLLISNARVI